MTLISVLIHVNLVHHYGVGSLIVMENDTHALVEGRRHRRSWPVTLMAVELVICWGHRSQAG